MNHRNRLEIAEYTALFGSLLGSIAATVSGQIAYIAIPMLIALWLNLINRKRWERRSGGRAIAYTNKMRQELLQQINSVQTIGGYIGQTRPNPLMSTESLGEIKRVKDAIASLQLQLQNRLSPSTHQIDQPAVQQELSQLQDQYIKLQESLENIIHYLNSASLPARVDRLEKIFSGLPNEISQLVQNQLDQTSYMTRSPSAETPKNHHAQLNPDVAPLPRSVAVAVTEPINQTWNCVYNIAGHRDWVKSIAISPRANILASGSFDGTIKIWQMTVDGLPLPEPLFTLSGHSKGVYAIGISPDGNTLVSGSFDETIKIWQLNYDEKGLVNPSPVHTLTGHLGSIRAIAINPNGQILASGSFDETIKIWQLATGELSANIVDTGGPVYALAFSPDGQILASGGGDGTIALWQINVGHPIATIASSLDSICTLNFSSQSYTLAAGSGTGIIKFWQLSPDELGRPIVTISHHTLNGHSGPVYAVTISPDGDLLASGSADGTVKIWHLGTEKLLATLDENATSSVLSVAISPDGQTLACGRADGNIKIWQQE